MLSLDQIEDFQFGIPNARALWREAPTLADLRRVGAWGMAVKHLGLWGLSVIICFGLASAANAQTEPSGAAECVADTVAKGGNPADCIAPVHAPCMEFAPAQAPQAALCFVKLREGWDSGIKTRLDAMGASADPVLGETARIESKYDLLSNQLQCDRLDELSALYGRDETERMLQKTRCEATASAVTFIRLLVRSGAAE